MQDSNLSEAQVTAIAQAFTALSRLSKLNKSLLLLAKIENNQFEASERISLAEVTKKYLHLFDEIIKDKGLKVDTNNIADFAVLLHPFLADSLVSNLLGNAIKYNHEGGAIHIRISSDAYCIRNTSHLPAIDAQQLYQRFKTGGHGADHATGLGLAIVKRIVDTSHLSINYEYTEAMHCFCMNKNDNTLVREAVIM